MDLRRITLSEIVAATGGVLLALSVFVKWYEARPENRNANINGMKGVVSAWDAHSILRYLLLAAALAPIVLLYIVVRDHELMEIGWWMALLGTILITVGGSSRASRPNVRASHQE